MRIATGGWKARKHKAMADEARRSWAALKRSNGGRVWARHTTDAAKAIGVVRQLAVRGKQGVHMYAAVVT